MAIPVQCAPEITFFDFTAEVISNLNNGVKNPVYSCYLQTPDNLKGKVLAGYPYFDFEAVRQPEKVPDVPPASEGSTSSNAISVVCVDFGNAIDFTSQSFGMGIFVPIFFFFIGMSISAIYNVIRSL